MHDATSLYVDDDVLLSRYRDLVSQIAAQEAGKINSLSFLDFVDDPVVMERDTCYVDVKFSALYHDPLNDALYEVDSLVWFSPAGRVTVVDYNSSPVSRADGDPVDIEFPWEVD